MPENPLDDFVAETEKVQETSDEFRVKWIDRFTALAVGTLATGACAMVVAFGIRLFRWIAGI